MLALLSPQVGKREETQFQQQGLQAGTHPLFLPTPRGQQRETVLPWACSVPRPTLLKHLVMAFCCFGRDLKLARATRCPLCLQPCLLSPCFGFFLESCPCYLRAFATAVLICGNFPLCEHLPVLAQLPLAEQPGLAPGPAGWVPLLYCQPNELLLHGSSHVINYACKPRNNYLHISSVLIGS